MLRRGRLNVKPNLAKGGQKTAAAQEDRKPTVEETREPPVVISEEIEVKTKVEAYNLSDKKEETILIEESHHEIIEAKHKIETKTVSWPPADLKRISRLPVKAPSPIQSEYSPERIVKKNEKKNFNGEEALDTKTMRIMDMIYWNPKKGHALTKKPKPMDLTRDSTPLSPTRSVLSSPTKTAAPQVKIGPDGSIILDETSLHMSTPQNDTTVWETVDDDRMARKVTSLSFRNRLWRKGTMWTEKETELFYEILRCTGPDFGLMHEYFPGRARCELKSKYNREERSNWAKLKEILSMPLVLDDSLMKRVERLRKEIDDEAEEKQKNSRKRKNAKTVPPEPTKREEPASIDWDESKANLQAEAEEIIHELEAEKRREVREARGDESESSVSDAESSGDEGFIKSSRAEKNKKKFSDDARKIIMAVRKQAREMAAAKKKQKTDEIAAKQAINDVPEIVEDPDEIREAYPVPSASREGITDPILIRAAKNAIRANEKRRLITNKMKLPLPKPNFALARKEPVKKEDLAKAEKKEPEEEIKQETLPANEEEDDDVMEEIIIVDDDPYEPILPSPKEAPESAEVPSAETAPVEAELNLIGKPKTLSRRRAPPNIVKRPRIQ